MGITQITQTNTKHSSNGWIFEKASEFVCCDVDLVLRVEYG
jgi:hypothetical protein